MDGPASLHDRPPAPQPDRRRDPAAKRQRDPDEGVRSAPAARYRATLRTDHKERLAGWAVVAVATLAILTIKPWGGPEAGPAVPPDPSGATTIEPTRTPIPTTTEAPRSDVAGICMNVGAWLVTSVELDRQRTIRVWRAIDFATSATGPLDPSIPLTQLRTDGVLGLGWCAPTDDADGSTETATVDAWQIDGQAAIPIALVAAEDTVSSDDGALYRPADRTARFWATHTYVFHHVTSNGREHWFKVRVLAKPHAPAG
jgi:hypothetical protein